MAQERLRIAIQKSGRLHDQSAEVLRNCGIKFTVNKRSLISRSRNMPIDILLVRDDDIPTFVSEGVCDLGIVGENEYKETTLGNPDLGLSVKTYLGFSRCDLSIAVPRKMKYEQISDIKSLKIATSYPNILSDYLKENNVEAEIVKMEGSVEVAPHLEIADLICDLVSTGSTLEANGLKEVETILKSQALLIERSSDDQNSDKQKIINKLMKRINGVIMARDSKYVMLNAPKDKIDEITKILPGADSPTIIPLGDGDKVAIHTVCSEPVFWETMESLKKQGATAILVVPIEKMLS